VLKSQSTYEHRILTALHQSVINFKSMGSGIVTNSTELTFRRCYCGFYIFTCICYTNTLPRPPPNLQHMEDIDEKLFFWFSFIKLIIFYAVCWSFLLYVTVKTLFCISVTVITFHLNNHINIIVCWIHRDY